MPLDPVQIDFQAAGVRDVLRAFDTIEKTAERAERQMSGAVSQASRTRVASAKREVDQRERDYQKMVRQFEREEREATRAQEKASKDRERSQERETASAMRQVERLRRERERASAEAIRLREREAHEAERLALQQARAEERAAQQAARAQASAIESTRRHRRSVGGSLVGTVGGSIGRATSAAVSIGGAALALGGGFAVADALRSGMNEEKAAIGLFNSLPGDQQKVTSVDAIRSRGRAIQAGTHIDKAEAIQAIRAYVAKTGDASLLAPGDDTAMQIARVSKATDSDFGKLMASAGLMKAQNKNLSSADMLETIRIVAAQGMKGAIEISDVAQVGGKITASRGAYAMNQTDAQRQLLGLAQVVLPTSGSVDDTATVINRFSQNALMNADKLPSSIVDKKTGLLKGNLPEIVATLMDASGGGRVDKVHALGFRQESIKLFEQLSPAYREAYEGAGGDKNKAAATKAAHAAIAAQIGDVTSASMTSGEVDERFARVMTEKTEKIDAAMQRLRDVIADKGLPILEHLIDKLPELLPKIESLIDSTSKLASWFAENPFKGIGALVLAEVTKDLVNAGIGAAVKASIQSLLTQGGSGPGGLPTAAQAGGNGLAAAGALAVGAAWVGTTWETLLSAKSKGGDAADLIASEVSSGKMSAEQAQKLVAEAKAKSEGGVEFLGMKGEARGVGMAASYLNLADRATGGHLHTKEAADEAATVRAIATSDKIANAIAEAITRGAKNAAQAMSGGSGSMADPTNPARRQSIPQQPTHQ